ncbi:MAG: DNA polymerase III subunit gamma/tau, partial [Xanthobacteraceae bacterium]
PMAAPRQSENPAPFDEPVARDNEVRAVKSFADLLALAAEKRDLTMKSALERDVRLVRFEDGTLELALEPSARKTLVQELSKKLADWTGRRWMVAVSAEAGQPSLRAQADARKAELKDVVREDPLVQAVLQRFPGAEIVDVRPPAGDAEDLPPETPANESDSDA